MRPRARPLSTIAWLLAAAALVFGWQLWREASASRAARAKLFEDVDVALSGKDRHGTELSRLVARLREMDQGDRKVVLALARIEALRQHYERAAELLEPLLLGADVDELHVAAVVWLGLHATAARDRTARIGLLRQALDCAESAVRKGGGVADQFLAWQAAVRLGDDATAARYRDSLTQQAADSREARTVLRIETSGDLDQPIGPVADLIAEWDVAPVELALMHAVLLLQQGGRDNDLATVERGTSALDELLARAPNLLEVRNWAATGHHMGALMTRAGTERARHVLLRDQQLDWLGDNAEAGDARRPKWLQMRQGR